MAHGTGSSSTQTLTRKEGKELRLYGELMIVCLPTAGCAPAIEADDVAILDARGIISDAESGEVFYGHPIPLEHHGEEMAKWIQEHPEWEQEFAPNGVPKISLAFPDDPPPNVVIGRTTYVAPRVGMRPQDGREIRRATCGHDVYLSERGVDAVDNRGKQLVCAYAWPHSQPSKGWTLGSLTHCPRSDGHCGIHSWHREATVSVASGLGRTSSRYVVESGLP